MGLIGGLRWIDSWHDITLYSCHPEVTDMFLVTSRPKKCQLLLGDMGVITGFRSINSLMNYTLSTLENIRSSLCNN